MATKPKVMPPALIMQGASRSSSLKYVPVWASPAALSVSIVRKSPSLPLSRQWLLAVVSRSKPTALRSAASSSGALKVW